MFHDRPLEYLVDLLPHPGHGDKEQSLERAVLALSLAVRDVLDQLDTVAVNNPITCVLTFESSMVLDFDL